MDRRRNGSSHEYDSLPREAGRNRRENHEDPKEGNLLADAHRLVLLVVLYTMQGFPMGFVFGSIPFLLKASVGFNSIGVFSFAGWPYSIKLLIAPIVDSVYSSRFGRRKSWIVPVQTMSGILFLVFSSSIEQWVKDGNVRLLTPTFFFIMLLTATQDIAVDAWALTLLHPSNLAYASTCQTLGLSIGYFSTFTIFLGLQDESISNRYIHPLLGGEGSVASLGGAMKFVGIVYEVVTVLLILFADETTLSRTRAGTINGGDSLLPGGHAPPRPTTHSSVLATVGKTYRELFAVLKLPAIRSLLTVLLTVKTGFSAYDNVTALKLLDLGFPKESMAMMAVVQAPFALVGTILVGRWVSKAGPVVPYLTGFTVRLVVGLTGPIVVRYFAALGGQLTTTAYFLVLVTGIAYSMGSECLMFVSQGTLFLSISERDIGGSYLTMLNTSSNMGGMWHKSIVLYLVDLLTLRESCDLSVADAGEKCPVRIDGYYAVSFLLIPVALVVGNHARRTLTRLVRLPESAWRSERP